MKTVNDSAVRCPLKTPPFENVFDDFYFKKNNYASSPKHHSGESKNISEQLIRGEPLPQWITYKHKKWKHIEDIYLSWEKGHLHNPQPTRKGDFFGYPAHLHSDLSILDQRFHIDFYAIGSWGLGSSLKEIRVYKNDALINRGGNGNAYIASFKQNLPLVISIEKNILLFGELKYDSEKAVLDIPISLWQNTRISQSEKL
jgi:hypothetical protein